MLLGLFESASAAFEGSTATAVTNVDAAAVKVAVFRKSALLEFIDNVDDIDRASEESKRLSAIVNINVFMMTLKYQITPCGCISSISMLRTQYSCGRPIWSFWK